MIPKMERHTAILETSPESKYTFLVEEIVNDKICGGYHDMYKDFERTSYDIIVAKFQNDINSLNRAMKENRKLMDSTIASIENSKKKLGDKDYKKPSAKQVEEWQKMCPRLQGEFVEYKAAAEALKPRLDDIIFNRYIEAGQLRTMRHLRNKFIQDNDREYLEKGVTWALNYAARHRLKIDMKVYT
jgi:predicted RNase H-like nuclease (RuvC/YqgF family)